MGVRLSISSERAVEDVLFGFSFVAADGAEIMGTTAHDGGISGRLNEGESVFQCAVEPMALCPGRYFVRGAIFRVGELMDHIDEMTEFDVLNLAWNLDDAPKNHLVGYVYFPFKWVRLS